MKRISLSLLLLLFCWSLAAGAVATRDPSEYFFDQFLGDLSEDLELARDEGKAGILVMFEMDECPFCHRMKTTVLNQVPVQEYFKQHFIIVPVDIEGDLEITDFAGRELKQKDFAFQQFRVRATPVFAFFDLQGKLVARYTGATRNAEEFLWLGEYVVSEAYKTTKFTRYKRQRKKQAASR